MKKIAKLIVFGASAMAFASCAFLGSRAYVPMLAEGETTSSAIAESSSEAESVSSESSSSTDYLADSDSDGIPDVVKSYYDEIMNQQIFGVSVGAIIGTAFSLLAFIFTKVSQSKLNKTLIASNETIVSNNGETSTQVQNLVAKIDEITAQYNELLGKYTDELEAIKMQMNDLTGKLTAYAKTSAKTDAILENTVLLAKTDELVKKGISEQAEKNRKGAQ